MILTEQSRQCIDKLYQGLVDVDTLGFSLLDSLQGGV